MNLISFSVFAISPIFLFTLLRSSQVILKPIYPNQQVWDTVSLDERFENVSIHEVHLQRSAQI
jgi:hypothetical protein